MTLEQAFFILEYGSSEGENKYFEAVRTIKEKCIPVVRCKDCKYYRYDIKDEFSSCYLGSLSGPGGNDFCCYGEQKE